MDSHLSSSPGSPKVSRPPKKITKKEKSFDDGRISEIDKEAIKNKKKELIKEEKKLEKKKEKEEKRKLKVEEKQKEKEEKQREKEEKKKAELKKAARKERRKSWLKTSMSGVDGNMEATIHATIEEEKEKAINWQKAQKVLINS